MPDGWAIYMVLELQQTIQAFCGISTALPAAAILVASLPNQSLANGDAIARVFTYAGTAFMTTLGLCLVHAVGSETKHESYWICWLMLLVAQSVVVAVAHAIPNEPALGSKLTGLQETVGQHTEDTPMMATLDVSGPTAPEALPEPEALGREELELKESTCNDSDGNREVDTI